MTASDRRPITTAAEVEALFAMRREGRTTKAIARELQRHPRTIRSWLKLGRAVALDRARRIQARKQSGDCPTRRAVAARQRAADGLVRPRHVTARLWSDRWLKQQQAAFAAAIARAHPELARREAKIVQ